jgi:DNA mismatch repair ATPase MutS
MDSNIRKNPSRKECEKAIRRILITEILENGKNKHFRMATDFITYFEALYPASDSLTKQVQRAVKAMNMPKDEDGFFIIDRTPEQMAQDRELQSLFNRSDAQIQSLEDCEQVFVRLDADYIDYLIFQMEESDSLRDKYVTIQKTSNGMIIYTKEKKKLEQLLQRLMLPEKSS